MPFFNHAMAQSIQTSPQMAVQSHKQIRSMPGNAPNGATVVYQDPESTTRAKYRIGITQRKLMFTRSLIRAQVDQVMKAPSPYSIEQAQKLFESYTIDKHNCVYEEPNLKIFGAKSNAYPEMILLVRIYSRTHLEPDNSMFIKILRHLGRKHPFIIHTSDMFSDQNSVYIFQELALHGNMLQFLEKGSQFPEQQVQFWAKQLFRALDFLGDQAIVHRSISPNHILVKQTGHEIGIKLTGFKHSIIYWDSISNDVRNCPCWSAELQKTDGPNFQAPEVYGNAATEEFDPILADTWSYGANVYFMLAKEYPYNMMGTCENIESETLQNIQRLTISKDGQSFLHNLMRANATDRIPFDFIGRETWLHPKSKTKAIIETPYKNLQKIKLVSKKSAGSVSHPLKSNSPSGQTKSNLSLSKSPKATKLSSVIKSNADGGHSTSGHSSSANTAGDSSVAGSSVGGSSASSSTSSGKSHSASQSASQSSATSGHSGKSKILSKMKSKSKSHSKAKH